MSKHNTPLPIPIPVPYLHRTVGVRFSYAALRNIEEASPDLQHDADKIARGLWSREMLRDVCLQGASDDRVDGWNDYVETMWATFAPTDVFATLEEQLDATYRERVQTQAAVDTLDNALRALHGRIAEEAERARAWEIAHENLTRLFDLIAAYAVAALAQGDADPGTGRLRASTPERTYRVFRDDVATLLRVFPQCVHVDGQYVDIPANAMHDKLRKDAHGHFAAPPYNVYMFRDGLGRLGMHESNLHPRDLRTLMDFYRKAFDDRSC